MPPRTATFTLPWPPSVNAAYRSVVIGGSVRVLLSREGRAYKGAARVELMRQRVPSFGGARVALEIIVESPDRRVRDIGNLDKLMADALSPQVIDNDYQVDYLVYDRRAWTITPGGLLRVTVTELMGDQENSGEVGK